jgi:hypothetical protein
MKRTAFTGWRRANSEMYELRLALGRGATRKCEVQAQNGSPFAMALVG